MFDNNNDNNIDKMMVKVLSDQNDMVSKFETEELSTDLISAIKEFEETTAKIQSAHQKQEYQRQEYHQQEYQKQEIQQQKQETHQTTVFESTTAAVSQADDKGPIDYFVHTKEKLRHVPQKSNHDMQNDEHISSVTNRYSDADEHDAENSYVKIPVQQLINTFEKQMRSIIKQKINENIQVKLDETANSSKVAQISYTNKDKQHGFIGKENETKSSEQQFSKIVSRSTMDCIEQTKSQQQQQQITNRIQNQSQSTDHQYQWSTQTNATTTTTNNQMIDESQQSIKIFESEMSRFNNSKDTQPADHFDGGKAIAI